MAKLAILAGSTSQSVNIFIQDSSVTTGAGLTGLVFNTSSLVAYYTFVGTGTAATAITLATLAAANSAFSSGGFKEISSSNMPGLYRLDIPDAALAAASGRSVVIMLKGATNMVPCVLEIELTAVNNQDAVRMGMTALPNAAAGANGGLPLSVDASGRVDVLKINGTSQTARDLGASVLLSSGTGAGQISLSSGTVTVGTNSDKTGYTLSNTGIDNILDRSAGVETGFTLRQAMRVMLASLAGKLSGAATTSIVIRDVNDTVDRISATVDSSGNRTAVTTNTA